MNREELIKLIEDNGLTLHGDIEHFAALVADHIYAKYLEQPTPRLTGTFSITASLQQPDKRNFCPRCGKRTADLTAIHTCTPPQENT